MSDDSKSAAPNPQKPRRTIPIGSQRPGYQVEPPAKSEPQPVSNAETPVDLEPGRANTPFVGTDSTAGLDPERSDTGDEAHAGTALEQAEAEVVEDQPKMPDIDLEMSDEDLEREIAAAMGQGVEDLMAGQISAAAEEINEDERYRASVLKIYRDSVILELPGQQNGFIPMRHFEAAPEPGMVLEVVVVGFSKAEQMFECIVPGASVDVLDWSDIQEGVVVEAKVTGHNKGGLECEVNRIRAFIPASQVSVYRVEDFSTYVDQTLQCVVTEANPERRNLVLSHRAVLEREREAARERLLAELAVGQTREGTVTRLEKFGAFVDLGGIDGLIHISQLSWDNIRHPSEVVSEGQKVKVRIEKLDAATGKIGLSYRDLTHHPWEGIEGKYPVGDIVGGTVSKIMDFGAFVKLEPGVEGLVHISELSHQRVNRVQHVVEEGQRVDVKILAVDAEAQRISLSMKQAMAMDHGSAAAETPESADEPVVKHVPKVPEKSLKGGVERPSGGDQFGLNW